MAKPDLFRIFGCIVMVTLIIVIAVKLSKQCMPRVSMPPRKLGSPSPSPSATASATPRHSEKQAHGVCKAGFRPDQNGFCVEDY